MTEFFEYLKNLSWLFALIGFFIEITPIKINPISSLFNKFGKAMNNEVNKKIDILSKDFNDYKNQKSEERKEDMQRAISDFANDIKHGIIKSETQYKSIIKLCDKYLKNGWNSGVELDAQFIIDDYNDLRNKIHNNQIFNIKKEK